MAIAMDSDLVPALVDLPHQWFGVLNILSDEEKRRANIMLCQHLQHPRRIARMRAVVEGERDLAAGWVTTPKYFEMAQLHP